MKRSSKRFAAIGATIVLASVGIASATMAQGGPDTKPAPDAGMDNRAGGFSSPSPLETSFVPVKPCRLFDTRNAGGPMANAETRSFSVKGALGSQGGVANCGIPVGATAASINLTAISEGGTSGFVRGWAATTTPTTATLLNFSPALNASNSVEVPLCEGDCSDDLVLKTFGSAHLVGEVLGYFVPQMHGEIGNDGRIVYGSPRVVSSERLGAGRYRITLDRDVDSCSVGATLGNNQPGSIAAYTNGGKIVAFTWDAANVATDRYFDFVVAC